MTLLFSKKAVNAQKDSRQSISIKTCFKKKIDEKVSILDVGMQNFF